MNVHHVPKCIHDDTNKLSQQTQDDKYVRSLLGICKMLSLLKKEITYCK